ncbi:MAG: membrane protein [Candidatus Neomarinimicrobiota bacterium]|nr:MAG: membrane protein [Candidatus Neomarinimicrobiota bacterium]
MGDLYAVITAVCWSSAVILFDISTKNFTAIQLNVLKNFIGVFGFILTIVLFSIPSPNFSQQDIFTLALSGFLGILIADGLFLESLRRLGSGLSAVVSTIYTPTVFIIAFILFNETINLHSYIGGVLVLGGITISVFQPLKTIKKRNLYIGILFGIIANILTAYSVLIIKPIMKNNSVVYVALYRFSIGFIFGILINVVKSGTKTVIQKFKQGLTNHYVILGALLGTYLSVIFWLAGYKYTLAGRAAIYNQLSTVFIIILARIFLKEPMTSKKVIGVSLAIFGAIIVSVSK